MSQSDFERTLDTYKTHMTRYKISGDTSAKVAANTAKEWLDAFVKNAQDTANKGAEDIQTFVTTHAKNDTEFARLKQEIASIRKEGPELQTIYETEREAQAKPPIDYTLYYAKGAALAGVAGLILVANMF